MLLKKLQYTYLQNSISKGNIKEIYQNTREMHEIWRNVRETYMKWPGTCNGNIKNMSGTYAGNTYGNIIEI